MVVLNPNNWHWVDKNTLPWSETYFNSKLPNFRKVSDDNKYEMKITKITKISGDSNVSQRKGKPICYFDINMGLEITVIELAKVEAETEAEAEAEAEAEEEEGKDEENVTGDVEIPEFMHDEDDFEILCRCSGNQEIERLLKTEFVPEIRQLLLCYQNDLIEEHSKDLQHE
ncbi:hypothetical protein Kpol_1053p23 [Vanderwaltozyma polyspora DSM 70294]|uniref:Activator of Hsp90 ATPase AHSA1-like N-terminal domain-containing protein n=1 Tax=Vanderwaltozyma polyspora (strain ATCC 22028 / DSM 70294 / BCRC 21397 / CBS 2163 / NBRC 10782 / NRRL Y-8283 / UCD 57-17) TaxID=436907 RepID=A7TN68_VANPO|nr:uncharacterized protein Kpol_1053p23 [Vanderwaltozyma polyspora DSM 70294]EDO16286.1 hypothetical protein Kpol_1053p23 [Vanderwaltozyma polyspora DSM 70294]